MANSKFIETLTLLRLQSVTCRAAALCQPKAHTHCRLSLILATHDTMPWLHRLTFAFLSSTSAAPYQDGFCNARTDIERSFTVRCLSMRIHWYDPLSMAIGIISMIAVWHYDFQYTLYKLANHLSGDVCSTCLPATISTTFLLAPDCSTDSTSTCATCSHKHLNIAYIVRLTCSYRANNDHCLRA